MTPLVHELAVDGYPVAVTCRVLKVSTSTYYDGLKGRPPSSWDLSDAYLLDAIIDIHRIARGTYGCGVSRQLTLGRLLTCCRQRVERLMRTACKGSTGAGGATDTAPRQCFRTWSSDSPPPSPAAVRSPAERRPPRDAPTPSDVLCASQCRAGVL